MIVLDASVAVLALAASGDSGTLARERLRGERLLAPHLLDLEVASALRRLQASGLLTAERGREAIDDLVRLSVRRVPHVRLLARCWELRHNLTVYDASYVALAEILRIPLLTADRRLAAAPGIRCDVEVIAN